MRKSDSMYSTSGWASIEEKIDEAKLLYERWEGALRHNGGILDLIERLDIRVRSTQEAMQALGVVNTCRKCEEEEGGSCCGAGIENRYTSLALLINLLLGASLPDGRTHADSCYFLSAHGCCLKARHTLCVNYLCAKLQRHLPQAKIIELHHTIGEELDTGFALYEAIKKLLPC